MRTTSRMLGLFLKTAARRPLSCACLSSSSRNCAISDAVNKNEADSSSNQKDFSQYSLDDLLRAVKECCRLPIERRSEQAVHLLHESNTRLNDRAIDLKHLAHHIQLCNYLGVADRWKVELLVEEVVQQDTREDDQRRMQLLSIVRLLLRSPLSRAPTAQAVREFGKTIGGYQGALIFAKMTCTTLALQAARNRTDMVTNEDVETMLSLARPYLGDYELNSNVAAVLNRAWHDVKVSSDDWSRLVQPTELRSADKFSFEQLATSLVSLYRGYNDQTSLIAALKKKEKMLIGRLFDLIVDANTIDSKTMFANSVDSKFLATLQKLLSQSGHVAWEALEEKWPLYELEHKNDHLKVLLETLSLLHMVFGEKLLEITGLTRWIIKKCLPDLQKMSPNADPFIRLNQQIEAVNFLFPFIRNQFSSPSVSRPAILIVESMFDQYTTEDLFMFLIEKRSKLLNEQATDFPPLLIAALKQTFIKRFCQFSATFRSGDLNSLNICDMIATLLVLSNFKIFPVHLGDRDFYTDLWQHSELLKAVQLSQSSHLVHLLRAASRAKSVEPTVLFWNTLVAQLALSPRLSGNQMMTIIRCYNDLGLSYPDYKIPRQLLPNRRHHEQMLVAVNHSTFCPVAMLQAICGLRSIVVPTDVLTALENLILNTTRDYSGRRLADALAYLSLLGHQVAVEFWEKLHYTGEFPVESVMNSILLQSVLGTILPPVEFVKRSLAEIDEDSHKGALIVHQMQLILPNNDFFPDKIKRAIATIGWGAQIADYLAIDAARSSVDIAEFAALTEIFDSSSIEFNCAVPDAGVVAKYVVRTPDGLLALDSVDRKRFLLDGTQVEIVSTGALLARRLLTTAGYSVASVNDIMQKYEVQM